MSIKKVAEHLGEHDTRLWRVVQHWVEVAQKDLDFSDVTAIGVDETSKRGHQYVTVFMDLNTKRVLYVTEGKDAKTITRFVEFLNSIQAIQKPFWKSAQTCLWPLKRAFPSTSPMQLT